MIRPLPAASLLLLLLSPPAAAQDASHPEPGPGELIAAFRTGDMAKLAELAGRIPDPWLMVNGLLFRGEAEAADAFTKAGNWRDSEQLRAYVAACRAAPLEHEGMDPVFAAAEAIESGRLEDVLAMTESLAPGSPLRVADLLLRGVRVRTLWALGRRAEASREAETIAGLAERLGWSHLRSASLGDAATAALEDGDQARALVLLERKLALAQAHEDPEEEGATLFRIAEALGDTDDPRAIRCLERDLELTGKDPQKAALNRLQLGILYRRTGDLRRARSCSEEALRHYERSGERRLAALAASTFAGILRKLGEQRLALQAIGRACELYEALGLDGPLGEALLDRAVLLHDMGELARVLDELDRAEPILLSTQNHGQAAHAFMLRGVIYMGFDDERAAECFQRSSDELSAEGNEAGVAFMQAQVARLRSDMEGAMQCLERAETLSAGSAPEIPPGWADPLRADILLGTDPERARRLLERTLLRQEETGDPRWLVSNVGVLAVLQEHAGELAAARKRFERARDLAEQLGEERIAHECILGLARVARAMTQPEVALGFARELLDRLPGSVSGLGASLGALARSRLADASEVGALSARDLRDVPEAARFLESGRAGALLESFSTREALSEDALPPELRQAEIDARAEEARCAAALRRARKMADAEAIRMLGVQLEAAQKQVYEVVSRIQRASAKAASVTYPKADDLATIQARLGPGEAMVLYGVYGQEALALVATREGARTVTLPPSGEIRAACAALTLDRADTDPAAALLELRKLVVEPLALTAEVRRLLVSPDADLCFVPFGLLLPDREIVYEPSGTVYGLLLGERGRRGTMVLALGDPDYRSAGSVLFRSGRSLRRLPESGKEAKSVGTLTLLGKDATEARLATELSKQPRWRSVHLACHGIVDREHPQRSALAVTPDDTGDGFLTVLEVFRMKCPADLVVLSACDTGSGKAVRGEGLLGLAHAFMYAGAPRVLASLWKVDDAATRVLMEKFYERWGADVPAVAALREAQAHVKAQKGWEHPAYWAAWVLWGLPE